MKKKILEEFKTLYNHTKAKAIPASILAKNLIQLLDIILRDNNTKKTPHHQYLKAQLKIPTGSIKKKSLN